MFFFSVVFFCLLVGTLLFFPLSSGFFSPSFVWSGLFFSFISSMTTKSSSAVIILISASILFYTFYYMEGEGHFSHFFLIVVAFVSSMLILVLSNSLFLLFLGWDGLGITSFLLIMFYSNWKSLNGSLLTLLSNRVGDGLLLVLFSFLFWTSLSAAAPSFLSLPFFLVLLTSMTKSAQMPISAWLPAAMAAPTPVSALVHSSTLVTAGVFLLMKFYSALGVKGGSNSLFCVGLLTIALAGLATMGEMDFKKLVALSTLSQMGMLIFVLGVGAMHLTLFHLLSHALFKSCLFLAVGSALHLMFSQQDWRGFSSLGLAALSEVLVMSGCLLALCGLFFSSGFVSKDLVLEALFSPESKLVVDLLFVGSLFLTFLYSWRLMKCFLEVSGGSSVTVFSLGSSVTVFSLACLGAFSLFFGFWKSFNDSFFFSPLASEKGVFLLILFSFSSVFLWKLRGGTLLSGMFLMKSGAVSMPPHTGFKGGVWGESGSDFYSGLFGFMLFTGGKSVGGKVFLVAPLLFLVGGLVGFLFSLRSFSENMAVKAPSSSGGWILMKCQGGGMGASSPSPLSCISGPFCGGKGGLKMPPCLSMDFTFPPLLGVIFHNFYRWKKGETPLPDAATPMSGGTG